MLGASLGYLMLKRQVLEGRLESAVREWEAEHESSTPAPPNGANFRDIKAAWRSTEDTRQRDFNERLPERERQELLLGEDALLQEVAQFDGHDVKIEGVYLEPSSGL